MNLDQRVAFAFDDDATRAYAPAYLGILTDNWREAEATLRRTLLLLLVTAAAFELIRSAHVSEAQILGIKLDDLGAIAKLLPTAVAYLTLQSIVAYSATVTFARTHAALHEFLHRPIYLTDLEVPLRPLPTVWIETSSASRMTGGAGETLASVFMIGTVLAAFGFQLYAYVRVVQEWGATDVVALIGFAFTLVLLARAAIELGQNPSLPGRAVSSAGSSDTPAR